MIEKQVSAFLIGYMATYSIKLCLVSNFTGSYLIVFKIYIQLHFGFLFPLPKFNLIANTG